MRASLGRIGGASTKAPLFPPSAPQSRRKKLSFQQKIKRAGSLPCGWGGGPCPPQVQAGILEAEAAFPGAGCPLGAEEAKPADLQTSRCCPKLQMRRLRETGSCSPRVALPGPLGGGGALPAVGKGRYGRGARATQAASGDEALRGPS